MGWSRKQTVMLHRAATLAGWNDRQRYIAMRHAGCPLAPGKSRPSVSHAGNTQRHFELVMSIAEGHACQIHGNLPRDFPSPTGAVTWSSIAAAPSDRLRHKICDIWAEACRRLPEVFDDAGLDGFVQRMTKDHDESLSFETRPTNLAEVRDPATLDKLIEGLKGWIGREFCKRDMTPKTFTIPRSVRRQLGVA